MAKLARPGPLLLQLNFSDLLPAGKSSMKIGSRAFILLLAETKNEITLNEIKGSLEGVKISSEDFRKQLGIYSETELENLKRELLNKDYLKQEKERGPYQLTRKGHKLLETYLDLLQLEKMVKQYEIEIIEKKKYLITNIPKLPLTPSNLSKEHKERLESLKERYELQKQLNNLSHTENQEDNSDPLDKNLPRFVMEQSLTDLFEDSIEPIRKQDERIREQIEFIDSKLDYITDESSDLPEEVVEVKNLIEEIGDRPEPPKPLPEFKKEVKKTTSLKLPDRWN